MNSWRGQAPNGRFKLEISASALDMLDVYCRGAGSLETGGILLGRYSDDLSLAIVIEVTPPPNDSRRGRSWFVRGVKGLRDLLTSRWRARERSFYIGEWHFHPVDHVEPSDDDFVQMAAIGDDSRYQCREPILIILGMGSMGAQRVFRAFVCPRSCAPLELHRIS